MDVNLFPTKGNLILAKNTLALSSQGYELLDKKRNILIREMWGLLTRQRNYRPILKRPLRRRTTRFGAQTLRPGLSV